MIKQSFLLLPFMMKLMVIIFFPIMVWTVARLLLALLQRVFLFLLPFAVGIGTLLLVAKFFSEYW